MDGYGLWTKFITHAGKGDELVSILIQAKKMIADAQGLRTYDVNRNTIDPEIIWVYETWDTKEEHDLSLQIEGVAELIIQAKPLLATVPEVIVFTCVS